MWMPVKDEDFWTALRNLYGRSGMARLERGVGVPLVHARGMGESLGRMGYLPAAKKGHMGLAKRKM